MTLQQNQSEAEQLDDLFVTFAKTLLSLMEEWTMTEQVPLTHYLNTWFFEDSPPDESDASYVDWHHEREEKKNYKVLLSHHGLDPFWKMEEVQAFIQLWRAAIGKPYSYAPSANSENPPIWLDGSTGAFLSNEYVSNELVTPILDAVDHYKK